MVHDGVVSLTLLTTERLVLRPATVADGPAVFALNTHPDVSEWIPISPATDPVEWHERWAEGRHQKYLLIELDGALIGELIIRIETPFAQLEVLDQAVDRDAEIGWILRAGLSGHGYASEAVAELLRHLFEDRALHRVHAEIFTANHASVALAVRLGMRLEGVRREGALHRTRGWIDDASYALLAHEWRAMRDA